MTSYNYEDNRVYHYKTVKNVFEKIKSVIKTLVDEFKQQIQERDPTRMTSS